MKTTPRLRRPFLFVACRLDTRDLSAVVTDAAGAPHRVAGPIACLDGSAAVRGLWLRDEAGGLIRVRFRAAEGPPVELVVARPPDHAWDAA